MSIILTWEGKSVNLVAIMDFAFISEVIPLYMQAAWLTLRIALISIALCIVLGILCAVIRLFKIPVLSQIGNQTQLGAVRNNRPDFFGRLLHG